jgi:4-aminobutyrate aminotransferase-like enzyme
VWYAIHRLPGRRRPCRSTWLHYGTPPLTLVRGEGAEVWDADGNRYLGRKASASSRS